MDTEEMMDDDLFADLYGDEEPKKPESGGTKPTTTTNGTEIAASKKDTLSISAQPTNRAPETAAESRANAAATAPAQPQQNQTVSSIEANGNGVNEDSYQGWEASQGKVEGNSAGGNEYNGYSGYEQEGEGYGDYSGGGIGNMVDVGGSTAIKEDGKMFIGGLNWETTDESLKNYFSQFGEVTECTVMRDGTTGRSRGFGFLTFKDPKTVNIVMVKEHYLDGKIIDPKRAIPRDEQEKTSKIFVGGVSQEATETDFREYFTQFGRVLDATLMMDKDTGRPRGFGFVTFDSEAAVENALNHPKLEIMGKAIEVKKAQPRGNPRERTAAMGGGHFDDDNRGGFNRTDRRDRFDRDGGASGGPGGAGYSQQGANGATGGSVQTGQGIYNGMSPQMMAQYWQKMQQYMAAFLQQQQQAGRGRGIPGASMPMMNPMMMMNPAMMQQFQQMQQMQMAQQSQHGQMGPAGGIGPMGQGMGMGGMGNVGIGAQQSTPQQQQTGPHPAQGPYGGQASQAGPVGYGGQGSYGGHQQHDSGYDGHHQQGPPQQHGGHGHGGMSMMNTADPRYQRQAKDYQAHHQRDYNPQQQSSWEGMYDDVPSQQPQQMHHQQQMQQQQTMSSAHSQHHPHSQQQPTQQPPQQPQQQRIPPAGPAGYNAGNATSQQSSGPPPNAPTGPRNARNPINQAAYRTGRGLGGVAGGVAPGPAGGVGPMRGPGGFQRGAVGLQGHGYHPYARNQGNTGGGADRGGY